MIENPLELFHCQAAWLSPPGCMFDLYQRDRITLRGRSDSRPLREVVQLRHQSPNVNSTLWRQKQALQPQFDWPRRRPSAGCSIFRTNGNFSLTLDQKEYKAFAQSSRQIHQHLRLRAAGRRAERTRMSRANSMRLDKSQELRVGRTGFVRVGAGLEAFDHSSLDVLAETQGTPASREPSPVVGVTFPGKSDS